MAERATIFENKVNIGLETIEGAGAIPSLQFGSVTVEPSYEHDAEMIQAAGRKYASLKATNDELSAFAVKGRGTYDETPLLCEGAIHKARRVDGTLGADEIVAGEVYRRWYWSNPDTGDDVQTYFLEAGGQQRASQAPFAFFTELGLTLSNQGMELDGRMMGQMLEDDRARYLAFASGTTGDFTLTITTTTTGAITYNATPATLKASIETALTTAGIGVKPTDPDGVKVTVSDDGLVVQLLFGKNFEDPHPWTSYDDNSMPDFSIDTTGLTMGSARTSRMSPMAGQVPLHPILRKHFDVWIARSFADIASVPTGTLTGTAVKMLRTIGFSVKLANRFGPIKAFNTDFESYSAKVELDPNDDFSISCVADQQGMAVVRSLRKDEPVYLAVRSRGAIIPGQSATQHRFENWIFLTGFPNTISGPKDSSGVLALDLSGNFADVPPDYPAGGVADVGDLARTICRVPPLLLSFQNSLQSFQAAAGSGCP
jgi:hypothetical protein